MKDTIRTFIAIKITPGKKLGEIYSAFKKSLNDDLINWVDFDNLHITLRFVGETSKEQAKQITGILDAISERYQPFQIDITGVGVFKNNSKPRVLFFSVGNDKVLKQLTGEINEKLVSPGLFPEKVNFHPHLTIGRIKYINDKNEFYSLVNRYADNKIQQVVVSEIIFYRSILSSSGPTYKPIKIVNLN